MTDITAPLHGSADLGASHKPKLDTPPNPLALILFFGVLGAGVLFVAYSLYADVEASGMKATTYLPYLLLFVALLIALGFEFVNGFHDTANAVATVIYTHALPAPVAVVWAGFFNFLGVVAASGAVAFGIISLLPVELILQVGSGAGFAMVFALLVAAIIWNLGTWYLIELAYADRLDHRRRRRQRAHARTGRHLGRRLDQGDRDRLFAAALPVVRLCRRCPAVPGAEVCRPQSGALQGARGQ
jgi:hypothetical protein